MAVTVVGGCGPVDGGNDGLCQWQRGGRTRARADEGAGVRVSLRRNTVQWQQQGQG
jgi:hypothetical protein